MSSTVQQRYILVIQILTAVVLKTPRILGTMMSFIFCDSFVCVCLHQVSSLFQAFRDSSDAALYRRRACTEGSARTVVTFVSVRPQYHGNL